MTALRWSVFGLWLAVVYALPVAQAIPPEATSSPAAEQSLPWPAQVAAGDARFVVHRPQLDSWASDRLEGRAAVEVRLAGSDQGSFGVIWFSARTQVDAVGMVTVRVMTLSRADFPTLASRASEFLNALQQGLSEKTWTVPRERLEADLTIDRASRLAQAQPLNNDPPWIIYSDRPAILVPVDGSPVLRALSPESDLLRVVNTRALILLDKSTGRYELQAVGRWFTAASLEGPWSQEVDPAVALDRAKEQVLAEDQVELLDDGEAYAGRLPAIYVSTRPAELLQTQGPPEYLPIERTQLLYIANSPNSLFLELKTGYHYALLAGRWYRTKSLAQGPWQYVSGASLPADFAMIPPMHPTQSVREAVPGTPQAQEAAIANSVPQVATVRRTAAKLEIGYDGEPLFEPIEGTTLQRALNVPMPVIRVDWNQYYALDNGVWFFADSPYGPWSVAAEVPPVIYTIRRSSPLHYVTYVRVYDATPDVVYVGYTPGYVGSYLSSDNVLVYGTGWYYRPWVGSVWYGAPVTWGFGFTIVDSWWGPWWRPWWPAWGYVYAPAPCLRPWWGPWYHPVPHVRAVGVAPLPGHSIAPIGSNKAVVHNFNRSAVNMTNLYNRWGSNVVLGTTIATRPEAPMMSRVPMTPRTHVTPRMPGGVVTSTPSMPRAPQAAQTAPLPRTAPMVQPGGDVISSSDGRVYRRVGGQWQRFMGNDTWQDVGGSRSTAGVGDAVHRGSNGEIAAPGAPRHTPPAQLRSGAQPVQIMPPDTQRMPLVAPTRGYPRSRYSASLQAPAEGLQQSRPPPVGAPMTPPGVNAPVSPGTGRDAPGPGRDASALPHGHRLPAHQGHRAVPARRD